jgi:hypothetical protein
MMKNRILVAMFASAFLFACGDDEPGTGDTGPTPDTGETDGSGGDTGTPDAGGEDTTDTGPEPDVTPDTGPTTETVCGDDVDNDNDGDTDCDDSDCETNVVCNVDPTCTDDPTLCIDGTVCVNGTCVEEGVPIDEYVPSDTWAYVNRLQLGGQIPNGQSFTEEQVSAGEAGTVCCYDVDGDGFVDNGLGTIASLAGSLLGGGDLDETIAGALEDGTIVLLAEYRDGAEAFIASDPAARLHFFIGSTDSDNDGEPNGTYDDWSTGAGTFVVEPLAYNLGSLIQFNRGTYDSATGEFVSPGERFLLSLPLDSLLPGIGTVDLTIQGARLEATLDTDAITDTVQLDIDGEEYGGARLGGYIALDDLFGTLDRVVEGCDCAVGSSNGEAPSICYGDDAADANACEDITTRYKVACTDRSYDTTACDPEADSICVEFLNTICGVGATALSSIPLADFDTDGNGVDDSVTVGIWLTMNAATIDESFYAQEGSGAEPAP